MLIFTLGYKHDTQELVWSGTMPAQLALQLVQQIVIDEAIKARDKEKEIKKDT